MTKIVAHFHIHSPDGEHVGDWTEVPIAMVPPVGANIVLQIGAGFKSYSAKEHVADFVGVEGKINTDLSDMSQFFGTVREIDLYTVSPCGELLVNVEVQGELE